MLPPVVKSRFNQMDIQKGNQRERLPKVFSLRTLWFIFAFMSTLGVAVAFMYTPLFDWLTKEALSKLSTSIPELVVAWVALGTVLSYTGFLVVLYFWRYERPRKKLNKVVRIILDVLHLVICVILNIAMENTAVENTAGLYTLLFLNFHIIPLLELAMSAEDYSILDASLIVFIEIVVKVHTKIGLAKWIVGISAFILLGVKNMSYLLLKKNVQVSPFVINDWIRDVWLSLVILSWIGIVVCFKNCIFAVKLAKWLHDVKVTFWHVVYDIIIQGVAIIVAMVIILFYAFKKSDARWNIGGKCRFIADYLFLLICFGLSYIIKDAMGLGALVCATFGITSLAQLIMPVEDYGILDALLAICMVISLELNTHPFLSHWIVLNFCLGMIVLKYIFLPSEPPTVNIDYD